MVTNSENSITARCVAWYVAGLRTWYRTEKVCGQAGPQGWRLVAEAQGATD